MPHDSYHSGVCVAESRDVRREPPPTWHHRLLHACLRAFPRIPLLAHLELTRFACLPDHIQKFRQDWHRLYANSSAFLSRFLALVRNPSDLASVIIDCFLLIRSTWTGRQLGPDLVYPMLSFRKRQSGYLARLILERGRDQRSYELRARKRFPRDIDLSCVVAIDLDKATPTAVENGYRTQADFYGVTCTIVLVETIVTLVLHFRLLSLGQNTWDNWVMGTLLNLIFSITAIMIGDGTLTLIQRSDTFTSGCAVLLDRDITVILKGKQSVVEAIAESTFRRSVGSWPALRIQDRCQDVLYSMVEALCEGCLLAIMMLYYSIFRPLTTEAQGVSSILFGIISLLLLRPQLLLHSKSTEATLISIREITRSLFRVFLLVVVSEWSICNPGSVWHPCAYMFYLFLHAFLLAGFKAHDYPIRSARLFDTLGHPHVRKWEFETLAAAATFQCLILCHGIARPNDRKIDVLAFLDILIPDDTDIWMAWKGRVADRIMHEDDISFTPTIAMFRDERQERLKALLDQAQFGFDKYKELYARDTPFDPEVAEEDFPRLYSLIWSMLFPFASNCDRAE